jgi:ribosomal protein L21E
VTPPRVILPIRPSQAAMIAQRAFAGAKVLGVKPRGRKYAVTLKLEGEVKQVTVDGETGDIQ